MTYEPTEDEEATAPRVNGFSFWEAWDLAVGAIDASGIGGSTEHLADYLAADGPLTPAMKEALADLLRTVPEKRPRGERGSGKRRAAETERALGRRILDRQQKWREQHPGRKKVPTDVTRGMIEDVINDMPADEACRRKPDVENVLRLLRNKARL
jgi:hypothetical protein